MRTGPPSPAPLFLKPLSSFLGITDLKTGCIIALLFAALNKVAGVYGLVSVLTGAGGSFAQISLYVYSTIALLSLSWAINVVKEEETRRTLYFAHLFALDHFVSTIWTAYFSLLWWVVIPHDGAPHAHSQAQIEMAKGGYYGVGDAPQYTEAERTAAAKKLWEQEQGKTAALIIVAWLSKFYFAYLLYSYAYHLRSGTYRALPHTRSVNAASANAFPEPPSSALPEDELADAEDFYPQPWRGHQSQQPSWGTFLKHGGVRKISSSRRGRDTNGRPLRPPELILHQTNVP